MEIVSKKVMEFIMSLPYDKLFTYKDIPTPKGKVSAVMQTLYRLVKEKTIHRYKKGVFYRPQKRSSGDFGGISNDKIMETYLRKENRRVGYITGLRLYNILGLTTQNPIVIEIASHVSLLRRSKKEDAWRFVKSYAEVREDNYEYLQFLDLLRFFPMNFIDLNREEIIHYFIKRLQAMKKKEQEKIIHFSLSYPPRVRAFLGALLEQAKIKVGIDVLRESLNPISTYRLHARRYHLPTAKKWNLYDDLTRKQSAV